MTYKNIAHLFRAFIAEEITWEEFIKEIKDAVPLEYLGQKNFRQSV